MGVTHMVRNADELAAVWGQVSAGDIISLASGDYGDALLRRVKFDIPVTLRSEDPENPAVFETLSISESKGLVVENVEVVLQVDEETSAGVRGVYISKSEDIIIRDSVIVGGDAVVGVPTDTDPETIPNGVPYIGEPIGTAVYITDSQNIEVSDNEVTDYQRGVTVLSSDQVLVADNDIHDLRGTPFRSNGSHNVTVEGNEFTNFNPINFGGYGDHGDFIHFWEGSIDEPITNLVVRDNFFHQGEGNIILGIIFSTPPESSGFENVIVENNVLYNGDRAGIVLENVHNGNVANNTLIQSSGDDIRSAPGIRIDFASSDINVIDNLASEVAIIGDRVDVGSITIQRNVDVQSHSPQGNNYVGDILLNGLVDPTDALRSDFALVPGLTGVGVGADIQNDDTVFFSAETASNDRTSLSTTLNVENPADGDATYTFYFSDGTSIEGTDVRHTFTEAGRHEVKLVADVNGRIETVTRTIEVFDPVKFDLGDLASFGEAVSLLGDVSVSGNRADFGGAAAQIEVVGIAKELEDLTEFSASFRFAFDEQSAGRETLARVTNYFTVMADSEKLTAVIWLDDGSVTKLEAVVPGLQSGNAFDIALVFDELTGTAGLYVDGAVVAQQEGIEQAMGNGGSARLYIGGSGSTTDFTGWIENFVIQTDASAIRPNDLLSGGNEEHQLIGGTSSITFDDLHRNDLIKDFDTGEDDLLDLRNLSDIQNFDDVLAASEEVGQNLSIETGDTSSITPVNVSLEYLGADDLLF